MNKVVTYLYFIILILIAVILSYLRSNFFLAPILIGFILYGLLIRKKYYQKAFDFTLKSRKEIEKILWLPYPFMDGRWPLLKEKQKRNLFAPQGIHLLDTYYQKLFVAISIALLLFLISTTMNVLLFR